LIDGWIAVLGLELKAFTLSHSTSPFLMMGIFEIGSQTICLGWLRTTILLIIAPLVARITGHQHQLHHYIYGKPKEFLLMKVRVLLKGHGETHSTLPSRALNQSQMSH
jgi:hypothetical protein